MRHLLRLDDWTKVELRDVFRLADKYAAGNGPRVDGCAALFFPSSSLRTRVSFERGAALMGLQPITFPPETLDKPEALDDVAGYLASWVDVLVVRHPKLQVLEGLASSDALPVVNAMTSENHPCEVLSDLYAISRTRDPLHLRFLFVGANGNIARAWAEAARAFDLDLIQCCPVELATPGVQWTDDLNQAVAAADVILTDAPGNHAAELAPFTINAALLHRAPVGVQLAPCPPFQGGREVSADAVASSAFVGYGFKKALLPVQQAVLALTLGSAQSLVDTGGGWFLGRVCG
ncbi:ornithine carbamoyltransferase (plasmid) [Frondihabitans sp. PAMC 28766]|uniref:ornithine carbamoyltransferase n=1 Tax=Frondihabitans sp. PAMC 28766 TaxID=1795630 RepID=UPI00078C917C|nr:ornithine carbamoyltransferase [Frondihabitans sp. PAMC 28766]AMM22832.1 ornithine carbamoyltransferase [Frondihabitans sp. PAMC 28766]